jgi:alkylation response protein AidB-like acyl-CoA dehydrogenase
MPMELALDLDAFRQEVRAYIRAHLPLEIRACVAEERMDIAKEDQRHWHRILGDNGWAVPAWPAEWGGTGWDDQRLYVFEREIALADAPRPMINGVQMLGPTIIEFGTEEQKARFLPGIVNGETFWCQGYSEPNAGSDLANLSCRARREGDEYVINGSKLWTTEGHIADWMFGVFRTDVGEKPQYGISFLVLDMKSPGIQVNPIITYDGTHEVNQVFFDDVRVPLNARIGDEHNGWGVAKYLLSLERFGTAEVSRSMTSLIRLKKLASTLEAGDGVLMDDVTFADRIAEIEIELKALELTEQRFLFSADADVGAASSMLKVQGTQVQQMILTATMEALALQGHVDVGDLDAAQEDTLGPPETRHASRMYFNYRKTSIYSGSNEVMKNILAKHVLGL